MKIGIMQSRLLPDLWGEQYQGCPQKWKEEFFLARLIGFDYIEWIYDESCRKINTREIKKVSKFEKVEILSICADIFIYNKIHLDLLDEVIRFAKKINVDKIVIPLLGKSDPSKLTKTELLMLFASTQSDVELCIETEIPPDRVNDLITVLDNKIKICYDTGNSNAKLYNPTEEFKRYGDHIAHVHIKNRDSNTGKSMSIEEGDTNFKKIFKLLKKHNYAGNFTLQLSRAELLDQLPHVERQISIFKNYLEKWYK